MTDSPTGDLTERTFNSKADARQTVWDHLSETRLCRFPFPPHGRIPNFADARTAAERLFDHEPWASARRIKVNPDAPQRPIRQLALERGIVVVMPPPRLKSAAGFLVLDPADIAPEHRKAAASLSGSSRYGRVVPLSELEPVDAIVTGSVAVTTSGHRCGKGEGYGDLELGILAALGHPPVPVATTVHDEQVVAGFPQVDTDLRLNLVVTPTRSWVTDAVARFPAIEWSRIPPDRLEELPLLATLDREGRGE